MQLNADKTSATLAINGELSAAEIDGLIAELGALRATMAPAVPTERPQDGVPGAAPDTRATDNPHFSVRPLRDHRVRLGLRNAGLGWMRFDLSTVNACALRDYLLVILPDNGHMPSALAKTGATVPPAIG